jgi:two-component system, OmpR family, KDP operon response regulator KdpE
VYRTLVIGEAPEECQALSTRLQALGFESTVSACDSVSALKGIITGKPDVVIFDADAARPTREVFQLLAGIPELPVMVLGSGLETSELVWYLDQGAATYVVKPVGAGLIAARVNSLLRRRDDKPSNGSRRFGNVAIDFGRREVSKNGRPVLLTPTEFHLMEVLAENVDRPCSRRMLLQKVWGEDFIGCSHYLRLYMGYLRSKLEDDPREPQLLLTQWGVGYRLVSKPGVAGPLPAGLPQTARA